MQAADARGEENAAAPLSHLEEERNHVMWLRLRERMRALLGQMRGSSAAALDATSSFRSPTVRNPRSPSPGAGGFGGFGVYAPASPSPAVSTPVLTPGQAAREEVRLANSKETQKCSYRGLFMARPTAAFYKT